jgi:Uma2 family endonuclease
VKEVWLVLGPEKQIEAYRSPADRKYSGRAVHGPGGRIASVSVPSFVLDLDSLFAK